MKFFALFPFAILLFVFFGSALTARGSDQSNAANVNIRQKNLNRRPPSYNPEQSNAANVDIDQANKQGSKRASKRADNRKKADQSNKAVVIIEQKNVAAPSGGY